MKENGSREYFFNELNLLLKKNREQLSNVCFKEDMFNKCLELDQKIFKTLFNLLPLGVSICTDPTCRRIIHNSVAVNYLRMNDWDSCSHSSESPPQFKIFKNDKELSPKEMPVQRCFWQGKSTVNEEFNFVWDDGVRKICLINVAPLTNEKGSIIGVLAISEDVTERKQVEIALRRSEDRFCKVFYSSPVMMTITRMKDLKHVAINDMWLSTMGYQRDEFFKEPMHEGPFFLNKDQPLDLIQRVKSNNNCKGLEIEVLTKSGEVKTVFSNWEQVFLDNEPCILGAAIDITERKCVEEALRLSEERFYKAFHSSPTLMAITRVQDEKYVEINDAALKTLGYSREEAVGKTSRELGLYMNSVDRDELFDLFRKEGMVHNLERKLQTKNGDILNLLISAELLSINGEAYALTNTVDITEFRKVEEDLKRSEMHKTNILESITDAFYTLDSNWQITYWNKAAENMKHLKKQEVMGKNLWSLFPKGSMSEFYSQYEYVKTEKKPAFFTILGPHSGNFLEVKAYPFQDGLMAFIQNVTDQVKMNLLLQQSEEKFYKVFHGVPIIMMLTRLDDGLIIDVNDEFTKATGYMREDVLGRTTKEIDLFVDYEVRREFTARVLNDGRAENTETDINTKSGEVRSFRFWSQLLDMDGDHCLVTGSIDVTEQKKLNKEIARLDKLNVVGEMAASIGHEIRNPLTSIRGFLQMFKEGYKEESMYIDLMIEELDRANGIITEYLNMAKNKVIELKPKYLDLVVKSIYPIVRSDAIRNEVNVILDLNKPPKPLIDENEIKQLILNLSRNAIEAMSPGSTLTIKTFAEHNEIVLSIKDEGPGLNPEIEDKLGTPFITTKEQGTGLGLAVCYSIATRHNAGITFETGPQGTTFYVRFPVPAEQPALS